MFRACRDSKLSDIHKQGAVSRPYSTYSFDVRQILDHYFNYEALVTVARSVDNTAAVQLMCHCNEYDN